MQRALAGRFGSGPRQPKGGGIDRHRGPMPRKAPKMESETRKKVALTFVGCATCILLAGMPIGDLHYLGAKPKWSGFDRIRMRAYLRTAGAIGSLVPSVGPLGLVRTGAELGQAAVDKQLPSTSSLQFVRRLVLDTPGRSGSKRDDSFRRHLEQHEQTAVERYRTTGESRYVREIKQRIPFQGYGLPFFDDWMILLCSDVVDGQPMTSFLVWGMGMVPDGRAPTFFQGQLGWVGRAVPLHWISALEREGVAKGYWVLLTESDETSRFSYEARHQKPEERKQEWLDKIEILHSQGQGMRVGDMYQ